jgi:hypothetical protein
MLNAVKISSADLSDRLPFFVEHPACCTVTPSRRAGTTKGGKLVPAVTDMIGLSYTIP